MYRALIVLISFFTFSMAHATIYQWTDKQGKLHYSQTAPRDKSLKSEEVIIKKSTVVANEKLQQSIQDSANEIAKSNADRKAAREKVTQKTGATTPCK